MNRLIFLLCLLFVMGCGAETTISAEPTPLPPIATPSPEIISPTAAPAATNANADVEFVRAVSTGENIWEFHVTVAHPDIGWDDYTDGWDVVLPDGSVIKPSDDSPFTRLLAHPHETEQPFTRSQVNITIPETVTSVTVRAHDIVDGFGGVEVLVDLSSAEGESFTVEK